MNLISFGIFRTFHFSYTFISGNLQFIRVDPQTENEIWYKYFHTPPPENVLSFYKIIVQVKCHDNEEISSFDRVRAYTIFRRVDGSPLTRDDVDYAITILFISIAYDCNKFLTQQPLQLGDEEFLLARLSWPANESFEYDIFHLSLNNPDSEFRIYRKDGVLVGFTSQFILPELAKGYYLRFPLNRHSLFYTLNQRFRNNDPIVDTLYFLRLALNESDTEHQDIIHFISFCESFVYHYMNLDPNKKYRKDDYIDLYIKILRITRHDHSSWIKGAFKLAYDVRNYYIHGGIQHKLVYHEYKISTLMRYLSMEMLYSAFEFHKADPSSFMTNDIEMMAHHVIRIKNNHDAKKTKYYTAEVERALRRGVAALTTNTTYQRTIECVTLDTDTLRTALVNCIRQLSRTSSIQKNKLYFGKLSDEIATSNGVAKLKEISNKLNMLNNQSASNVEFALARKIYYHLTEIYDKIRRN